jgi:hypothetical protein
LVLLLQFRLIVNSSRLNQSKISVLPLIQNSHPTGIGIPKDYEAVRFG